MLDFDEQGFFKQIFTTPLKDRPTLVIELIQRHNHNGFGGGNVKALLLAIQQEQAEQGVPN